MQTGTSLRIVTVELGERSYPVIIGRGLLGDPAPLAPYLQGRQILIVSNETVAPLYLDRLCAALPTKQLDTLLLPDGERYKTLEVMSMIFDALLESRHERNTTLVALGGGVVGDITGFAAATYQRGCNLIQVPTTLLAQVDSSVGGKTAVNHRLGKNMIGAFYQPRCVLIDLDTLTTLPPREYAAGLAEVIKYGLIADAGYYDWLVGRAESLASRDPDVLAEAVGRSCEIKASVVAEDETESGRRAILNFGHTFAHAIETWTGYSSWLHGEAVAAGMSLAMRVSIALGFIDGEQQKSLDKLLLRLDLPVSPPKGMEPEDFLKLMALDKKVVDGSIRLVLLKIGWSRGGDAGLRPKVAIGLS